MGVSSGRSRRAKTFNLLKYILFPSLGPELH